MQKLRCIVPEHKPHLCGVSVAFHEHHNMIALALPDSVAPVDDRLVQQQQQQQQITRIPVAHKFPRYFTRSDLPRSLLGIFVVSIFNYILDAHDMEEQTKIITKTNT